MDLKVSQSQPSDKHSVAMNSPDPSLDLWHDAAAMLEGPRRTCLLLLDRLEQSRVVLRDLTSRLRRS
jgi:hypothetical protein